jgi:hypothetical protein
MRHDKLARNNFTGLICVCAWPFEASKVAHVWFPVSFMFGNNIHGTDMFMFVMPVVQLPTNCHVHCHERAFNRRVNPGEDRPVLSTLRSWNVTQDWTTQIPLHVTLRHGVNMVRCGSACLTAGSRSTPLRSLQSHALRALTRSNLKHLAIQPGDRMAAYSLLFTV